MRPSLTIIFDQSVETYANKLAALLQRGGIATVHTSPQEYAPDAADIGDPASLLNGSDYAVLIISSALWEQVYSTTGYRATLDAAVKAKSKHFFVVLTENVWIPGFHARQVFIDLQARNAVPIAAEIMRFMKDMNFSVSYGQSETPDVVRTDTSQEKIHDYLSDLCVLSDFAGVIAFGAVVYEKGQTEVLDLLRDQRAMADIDLLAGPHLDLFAIADSPFVIGSESDSDEPAIKSASVFMEQFLGIKTEQVHYPSLIVVLIEKQVITHTATIPIIFLEENTFQDEFRGLAETIARGLRLWRLEPNFEVSDVWSYLMKTLRKDSFPVNEHTVQIDTGNAIDLFARSISYF